MACGQLTTVNQSYIGICYWKFDYPCLKWCNHTIMLPCGIKWCWIFPCGIKWCPTQIKLPCFKTCKGSIPYFCKKYYKVEKYCYDFSSIGTSCYVFVELLYGCCGGEEYSWTKACFGWVDAFVTGRKVCFDAPLDSLGPCRETYSIPAGGDVPGSYIDEGSVSIGGGVSSALSSKLGTCRSCIRASFTGFIFFLSASAAVTVFISDGFWWLKGILYGLTFLFLFVRLSHYFAARVIKRKSKQLKL